MIELEILGKCAFIFFARILDVSLGTTRTVLIGKGQKIKAFLIGFIEVFIWFNVARTALSGEVHYAVGIAYALGHATGTFVGIYGTEKFLKGTLTVQVITSSQNDDLVNHIRNEGYAVSVVDAKGKDDSTKYMLFIEINKHSYRHLIKEIKTMDKDAFVIANETKYVLNGFVK